MWNTWTTNSPDGVQWFIASHAMRVSRLSMDELGQLGILDRVRPTPEHLSVAKACRRRRAVGLGSSTTSVVAMISSRERMPATWAARRSSETP